MKSHNSLQLRSMLLACCLATAYPAAQADDAVTTTVAPTTTTTTSTATTTVGTSSTTEAKLSTEFAAFLGGTEQAGTVINGLRQGTAFDLVTETTTTDTTGATVTTTTTTTIDPPTGTMGYGNIRITLRLAQAQLNQLGITEPTPEQLSAVLIGGDLNGTQTAGILTLRADGMGWGQIAKQYGMTVGQLMGKGAGLTKMAAAPAASSQPRGSGMTGKTTGASTASGKAAHANGYIPSGSKSSGAGMVTAAGGSLGSAAGGNGKGQTHKVAGGSQSGAVSAGGQQVSMSGMSSASGGAKGLALGQTKKN